MIWLVLPTANPALCSRTFARWKERGYRTAACIQGDEVPDNCDFWLRVPQYLGWGRSINLLCCAGPVADSPVVVAAGDDMDPDPTLAAHEIFAQFTDRFPDLMGVMQPTGDPSGMDASGKPAAARICGSPWLGRRFIERWNGGRGPFWPGYGHYYADEELCVTTSAAGCLWQRPDLSQLHHHWSFEGRECPDYMKAVQARCWAADQQLFLNRQSTGFPGHRPLLPA